MPKDLIKYIRKEAMPTPFCAGCGLGILMQAILRAIDNAQIKMSDMVFASGIGCTAWIPSPHFAADTLHTPHGRPIAFATGVKLAAPEKNVMVISGDGDLASIGGNHLIHAARRDTDITVICGNNLLYGMTGGQVGPTTPKGARTSTTPKGNKAHSFDLVRLVTGAGGSFAARESVVYPRRLASTIKKAIRHKGFSFVETLIWCPTQYGRRNEMPDPVEMMKEHKRITKFGDPAVPDKARIVLGIAGERRRSDD
ncbi:MAG: thiamine pyrophosphate-dependent enzyme [Planctomycetota bacterium]|jgi:2-oxoglutarate ferredoxin oxidoreductase subunit beta